MAKKVSKKKTKKSKEILNKKMIVFPIVVLIVVLIIFLIPKKNKSSDLDISADINIHGDSSYGDTIKDNQSIEEIILSQKDTDEVKIGVNKYLEFLWMIDGAFDKTKTKFEVNGEKINDLSFKCEYRGTNDKCYGVNFEENYNKLFSNKVSMNRVYGDGVSLKWYDKIDGEYVFYVKNSCNVGRMNTKQSLILTEKTSKELKFKVYYNENISSGFFKGEHAYDKEFVLVKEDGSWKVRKAYYHNPCYIEYNIE